jgi:hypothetical protein
MSVLQESSWPWQEQQVSYSEMRDLFMRCLFTDAVSICHCIAVSKRFSTHGTLNTALILPRHAISYTEERFYVLPIKLSLFPLLSAFYEEYAVLIKFTSASFLFLNFFPSILLDLFSNSRATPADPSRHASVPGHTGWKSPLRNVE